ARRVGVRVGGGTSLDEAGRRRVCLSGRAPVGRADDAVLARHPADHRHHMGSISRAVLAVLIIAAATIALRDPAWVGGVTSGLRPWEEDPPGTRFRWTAGRASFFIPSYAAAMTLPLRAVFPGAGGAPVRVAITVDDRYLATIDLRDPNEWVRPRLPVA